MQKKKIRINLDSGFLLALRQAALMTRLKPWANPANGALCHLILTAFLENPGNAKKLFKDHIPVTVSKTGKVECVEMLLPLTQVEAVDKIREEYPLPFPRTTMVSLMICEALGFGITDAVVDIDKNRIFSTKEEILKGKLEVQEKDNLVPTKKDGTMRLSQFDFDPHDLPDSNVQWL